MVTSTITDDGRNRVRDLLLDELDEVGIGAGTAEPTTTDDALGDEILREAPRSKSAEGTGRSRYVLRLDTTDANNEQIAELGLFDDGELIARYAFAEIPKTDDFEVEFRAHATVHPRDR